MDLRSVTFILCFLSALPSGQARACPDGQSVVNCLVDPCFSSPCGTGETCVPNYCGGCNYECKTENKCKVGDEEYGPGETFPAGDGCNSCTCSQNGLAICTRIACPVCTYNGRTYKPGETFPSTDGCNTCTCSQHGSVSCTEKACPPVCPKVKCALCDHGFEKVFCKTCECKGESCGSKTCGADEYCNGSDCCPNWTKTARCANPCSGVLCGSGKACQPYCGCLARCSSWSG